MGKVVSLADKKFHKVNAGKIVDACDKLDAIVQELVFEGDVPPSELLPALAQRIGVYLSCTDADIEKICKKLAQIMYKHARKR